MDELKPCPFCGGVRLRFHYGQIWCKTCNALGPPVRPITDEAVAAAWNSRATNGVIETSDEAQQARNGELK